MVSLNSNSLSKKAKECILQYINNINCTESFKLPSEENLSKEFGVSRTTIRAALNELANEGIIFRRHGKGTFVNKETLKLDISINRGNEITQIIKNRGYTPNIKILNCCIVDADTTLHNNLNVPINSPVIKIDKVFSANDNPCVYSVDYLPTNIFNTTFNLDDLKTNKSSIYYILLNKYNIKIDWDKVNLSTTTNAKEEKLSDIFNCRNTVKSFMIISGINYDSNDYPIFLSIDYVDTDYISFNQIRKRNF